MCLKSALATRPSRRLLNELQGADWQTTLDALPGYDGAQAQSGQVLSLRATLPWWNYRKPKKS